jgi:superoxide reductase
LKDGEEENPKIKAKESIEMAKNLDIYKCEVCGNIVEVLHGAGGQLVCCGQPMKAITENTVEASKEKHIPVIEKIADGYKVSIGCIMHPMEENHYIEWIELLADGKAYRTFLKPGDTPVVTFCVDAKQVTAREYCNVHGLWKAEL